MGDVCVGLGDRGGGDGDLREARCRGRTINLATAVRTAIVLCVCARRCGYARRAGNGSGLSEAFYNFSLDADNARITATTTQPPTVRPAPTIRAVQEGTGSGGRFTFPSPTSSCCRFL